MTSTTDCPAEVDVAWLRRVLPEARETNRSCWPTNLTWAVVQATSLTEATMEVRHLIRREVRSSRVEQRDRGAYGLLVSRTALAHPDPKHLSLSFAMKQLYHAFEVESQKPGKVFHKLVRRRRRELGLPVPPEERVLPCRSQPSASLPAIDIAIDCEFEEVDASHPPTVARTLAILQTERRLEELEVALEGAPQVVERSSRMHRCTSSASTR